MAIPRLQGKLQVTKLDAAKRQLETAIRLWFHSGDPVSIHTLAAAARQVLVDINTKREGEPMGADRPEIRPEARKRAHAVFAKAENFFKHADRDSDATLTFTPEATRFYILEAADRYIELAGEQPHALRAFIIFHALQYPEVFTPQFVQQLRQSGSMDGLAHIQKSQFFAYAIQSFDRSVAG